MDFKDFQTGAQQHHFWFSGKESLIDVLLQQAELKPSAAILNIGAGTGHDLPVLKKHGLIYATDVDPAGLALIAEKDVVEKRVADACALPYPNNFFDAVVAFDVLEHIQDDQAAAAEIFRVLKPGGSFIFTVPAYQLLFGRHDQELGHYRRYSKAMLKKILHQFQEKKLGRWFCTLLVPAVCARMAQNITKTQTFAQRIPAPLNSFFGAVLATENKLIKKNWTLPWGLSLYGIYTKKN